MYKTQSDFGPPFSHFLSQTDTCKPLPSIDRLKSQPLLIIRRSHPLWQSMPIPRCKKKTFRHTPVDFLMQQWGRWNQAMLYHTTWEYSLTLSVCKSKVATHSCVLTTQILIKPSLPLDQRKGQATTTQKQKAKKEEKSDEREERERERERKREREGEEEREREGGREGRRGVILTLTQAACL